VPVTNEQYQSFSGDWDKIHDMFPGERPKFGQLISTLSDLQRLINCCVTFPFESVGRLLSENENSYQLIAILYPFLRTLGIDNAHAMSLKLGYMKMTVSPDQWPGEMKKILQMQTKAR